MKKTTMFVIIIAMISLWALNAIIIYYITPHFEVRGQIGDMFGAVNALFSGFAFVGLIYTIIQQQKEIKRQSDAITASQELDTLTVLLSIYSNDERKYKGVDEERSKLSKDKKDKILTHIEKKSKL